MSFTRIITTAIRDAGIAEANFDAAIKSAGFKTRFDWFLKAPASLQDAYNLKVAADKAVHGRLADERRVA